MASSLLSDLERFSIPEALRFEDGPGGLVRAVIANKLATATVYLHGAHVAEYQPAGQRPVLFMSAKSLFDPAKPIRGGVPFIFPWFGPRAGDAAAPLHGFARVCPWSVESTAQNADGSTTITFDLADTAETRKIWPYPFMIRYSVTVGKALTLTVRTRNFSSQPVSFENALHTYFAVSDVREVSVAGLAGATYLDKVDNMARKQEGIEPIRISGETDRLYLNTTSTCILDDPGFNRRIYVEKSGSNSTVVWNPWIAKAKAMADFGDEEWPNMICVESVNAAENAVTLPPQQRHIMEVRIRSEQR